MRPEVGEDRRQVTGALDRRAGSRAQIDLHFVGQDVGERRLAQAGRPVEQDVIEAVSASAGGFDQDSQVFLDPLLADHLPEQARAQAEFVRVIGGGEGREQARFTVAHGGDYTGSPRQPLNPGA